MALPPTPMPPAGDMPTPDAALVAEDEGMAPVLFTVMGPPEGPYTLEGPDDEPKTFDTPQALISEGIMAILNPGTKGAEAEFAGATKSGAPKGEPPLMG